MRNEIIITVHGPCSYRPLLPLTRWGGVSYFETNRIISTHHAFHLVFRHPKTTLAQVKTVYGEPASKDEFKGEGVRVVTYVYSPLFKVFGRTYAEDTSPDEKLTVVGYMVKDKNITTPSGFSVGMPYQAVVKKFGPGEKFKNYNGRIGYIYGFNNDVKTLTFYVDKEDKISEINLGTDF